MTVRGQVCERENGGRGGGIDFAIPDVETEVVVAIRVYFCV